MPGSFVQELQNTSEVELTVTGRATKQEITNPVWFVREDHKLYLVPVRGSDSDWFKNVLADPQVRITADGASITRAAVPVTSPGQVATIVDKFRARYGADQVAQYYPKTDVAVEVDLPD